ncbi:VOC family protein [Thermomonospora umbrina]|uniref:VOC family protein n=1 Tax=Thermomonospora umbrina TaxID=111806 RepID=UPI0011C1A5C8|nr:VOC family protein [Thermomonospora umbrina]
MRGNDEETGRGFAPRWRAGTEARGRVGAAALTPPASAAVTDVLIERFCMDVTDIAYAEFYAARSTGESVCAYFTTRLGFDRAAEHSHSDRDRVYVRAGEANVVVTTPRAEGGPVARWVDHHGCGIADLALYTEDLNASLKRAREAGLRAIHPPHEVRGATMATITGVGSLLHTLIQPAGGQRPAAPPPFRVPAQAPRVTPFRLIDHLAVCVPAGELAGAAEVYERLLGARELSREYVRVGDTGMSSRVLRTSGGGVTLVLAEPGRDRAKGQVDDFLAAHGGAGAQHMALLTDDIVHAVSDLTDRGAGFVPAPAAYYDHAAARLGNDPRAVSRLAAMRHTGVLAAADHGGLLMQIFTTNAPDPVGPFFLELIERMDGAVGFGTENAEALFAAREAASGELIA